MTAEDDALVTECRWLASRAKEASRVLATAPGSSKDAWLRRAAAALHCPCSNKAMPEYPDLTVYLRALTARVVGQPLEGIRVRGPALRRAFDSGVPYLVNVVTDPEVAYPRSTTGV